MIFIKKRFKILIICKANITRSIYMQGYMKNMLKKNYTQKKSKIIINSAGLHAKKGLKPHEIIQHAAKLNNFSLNNYRSKIFSYYSGKKSNVILTMEKWQKDEIINKFPVFKNKVYLITEFLWHGDDYEIKDITDPTGSNTDQYKLFLDTVHNEADRILHELSRKGIIL